MKTVTPLVFYRLEDSGFYTVEKLNFLYNNGMVKLIWDNDRNTAYLYDSKETIVHDVLMTLKYYGLNVKNFIIDEHKFYNILLININTLSIEQFSLEHKNGLAVKTIIKTDVN